MNYFNDYLVSKLIDASLNIDPDSERNVLAAMKLHWPKA